MEQGHTQPTRRWHVALAGGDDFDLDARIIAEAVVTDPVPASDDSCGASCPASCTSSAM